MRCNQLVQSETPCSILIPPQFAVITGQEVHALKVGILSSVPRSAPTMNQSARLKEGCLHTAYTMKFKVHLTKVDCNSLVSHVLRTACHAYMRSKSTLLKCLFSVELHPRKIVTLCCLHVCTRHCGQAMH